MRAPIQHNKPLRAFYRRLVEGGKDTKLAIVAVMGKLVVITNAMMKSGQPSNALRTELAP